MVARLASAGVRHMFGVPGGECNLDFIAAAKKLGLSFVLTRTETAATIMAAVTAELTGTPGVAMTTRGPGLASAVNGVAYCDLDRAPVLLIADGYEDEQEYITHQRIDQVAILAPMLRASSRLREENPLETIERLLAAAQGNPPGPAYLEVAGSFIRGPAKPSTTAYEVSSLPSPDTEALNRAGELLSKAKRPILLAGLQARTGPASEAIRDFLASTGCPVLTTYKAKGVVSELDPLGLGLYAGGVAEEGLIASADMILLVGFDPVEGPPQPWRYAKLPSIELTNHPFDHLLVEPSVSVVGDISRSVRALADRLDASGWTEEELARRKHEIWSAALVRSSKGIAPVAVVEAASAAFPQNSRITIDAGAHMLPVLHLWRCTAPNQSLISRGLSTMGFALPAAVAASLADPERTTIAFTGDGGLMMCLGELGTALESGARPIVVVFNDSSLTLIGAKQKRRRLAPAGVDFGPTDFAAIASGFGWHSQTVREEDELEDAFAEALASGRPSLVDVRVDPQTYDEIILRVRG